MILSIQRISAVAVSISCADFLLALVHHGSFVDAKDQQVQWAYGMKRGGRQVDILQCQKLTLDWSTNGGGSNQKHDVYEFPTEDDFNSCKFDLATKISDEAVTGLVELSGS